MTLNKIKEEYDLTKEIIKFIEMIDPDEIYAYVINSHYNDVSFILVKSNNLVEICSNNSFDLYVDTIPPDYHWIYSKE